MLIAGTGPSCKKLLIFQVCLHPDVPDVWGCCINFQLFFDHSLLKWTPPSPKDKSVRMTLLEASWTQTFGKILIFSYTFFGWKSWEFHCYVRSTAGQEGWLDLGKLQDHCWVVNMVREALKSKIHGVEEAVRSTTKETRKPLQRIAYMKLSRYPWLCHYVSQLFGDQQKTHLGLREFIHQHLANLGAFFFWDVGSFPHQAGSLTGSLIHPIPEMLGGAPRHRHLQVRKPGLLCLGGAESNGSEIRQSPVER